MGDSRRIGRGSEVRVAALKDIEGLRIRPRHRRARRAGLRGVVLKPVPGLGRDVFYVEHENGSQAVYLRDELERI